MLGVGLGLTTQRRRAAASGPDLTAGLLAFWQFDGDGEDSSGNDNDLTMADATYVDGLIEKGLSPADGTSTPAGGTVSNPLAGLDPATGPYSVSFWFYRSALSDPEEGTLVSADVLAQAASENPGLSVRIESDAVNYKMILSVGDGVYFDGVGDLAAGVWHHAVVTVSPPAIVGYLNGAEWFRQDSPTALGDPFGPSPSFNIFSSAGGLASLVPRAVLDLAGLWGRALSPAEILTLYNGGVGYAPV